MTRLDEPFQRNLPAEIDAPNEDVCELVRKMEALRAEADRLSDVTDGEQSNVLYDAAYALENEAADICVAFNIDLGNVRASLAAAAE